jgi:hypothetical protein
VPASIPGAGAPRLLSVSDNLWAVVADAPLERFAGGELQKELEDVEAISRHALAHAAIVEFFFRRADVVPLKLFTLFSSDEAAAAHVRERRAELLRLFRSLHGLEEWGVRIVAGHAPAAASGVRPTGRDYLQVKKRLNETNAPSRAVRRAIEEALAALGRQASKTRAETFPAPAKGRPYVAGASYLVPVDGRAGWKKTVARVTAALAEQGHRLEMSGPWPPYHFVSS